jgi:hypothetical protein
MIPLILLRLIIFSNSILQSLKRTHGYLWVFSKKEKLVIAVSDSVAIANYTEHLCLCAIASSLAMTRWRDMGKYGYSTSLRMSKCADMQIPMNQSSWVFMGIFKKGIFLIPVS